MSAFPDCRFTIDHLVGEGEMVSLSFAAPFAALRDDPRYRTVLDQADRARAAMRAAVTVE